MWYSLVPKGDVTSDMIRESALSLNPYADKNYIVEVEKGLREICGKYFVLKFTTRFAKSCEKYTKFNREDLELELERLNHVDRKHI